MGRFTVLLQNRWILLLVVLLVVVLIVETTILVIIMADWSLGSQNFPKFSLNPPVAANCSTLTSHLVSRNSDNRTLLFDCSTSTTRLAAFRVYAPLTINYHAEPQPQAALAEPVFRLPNGYLNLSLSADSDYYQTCIPRGAGLVSGRSMYIGDNNFAGVYNYCAVVSNTVSQVEGFSIQWVQGTPPPPTPTYTVSASSYAFVIPAGQTGSCILTLTSYYGYNATLFFTNEVHPFVPGINVTGLPYLTFQPSSIFLPPNGTVRIFVTIFTSSNTTTATGYLASIYTGRAGQKGSGALLDIRVT